MLQKEGMNLTAVTVAVENGHTVAFLGTSDGKILKVTNCKVFKKGVKKVSHCTANILLLQK